MKWLLALVSWIMSFFGSSQQNLDPQLGYVVNQPTIFDQQPTTVDVISPTIYVTPTKTIKKVLPTKVGNTAPWGVAQQVGEYTWTMKVGQDPTMATPREILEALNIYRVRRGSQQLTWNENLAAFAQSRADFINSSGTTDEHKGFQDYLDNQDGFNKLGFSWLGENISIGYRMNGVHLIEWIYAGDKPHDDNQVNNRWNYVGIGVRGTATALIFGTGKR